MIYQYVFDDDKPVQEFEIKADNRETADKIVKKFLGIKKRNLVKVIEISEDEYYKK